MYEIFNIFRIVFEYLIFFYAILIISGYLILSVISAFVLRKYQRKNSYVDYEMIISSPLAPSISLIAPAYNESKSIIENVRALLSVFYHDYEVIIVNDGSKDDTLEKLIKAYDLEKVNYAVNYYIECKDIRGVYKSRNKSFSNLFIVDKENGGKADALNAGINISEKDFFIAVDVDSIIESDALLKLVKPFMEEKHKRIIATGGAIRIANSCVVESGRITDVNLPRNFLARFQVLEYTRAFLMNRMAWSELNGLLLISGALGLFDKEIAIACGGYFNKTVGEDMELVVRMRRYMAEHDLPYKVKYIPDPLCWTEVPNDINVLFRQRNRWTRGTIETLFLHKKLFFNPKYKIMGILGYPYWFFFEWMAPLLEFFGIFYFIIIALFGLPNWDFFLLIFGFIYFFSISFSTAAILFEETTFHKYENKRDVLKLFFTAWLEPFIYHPFVVYSAIRGNYDYYVLRKKGWGKMIRKGFGNNPSK